jgi:hypothetical protein
VVGDTAWSLIAQLDEHDITRYFEDRSQRGFNAVIVNLIEHKFASHAPANRSGVTPFLEPASIDRPNPAYFDFAHRAVAEAERRGISVWLCPAYLGWGGGDEGFFREIKGAGRDALRAYGRFVGGRFKDLPNVVWMMGGDYALPPSERWAGDALAAGLREGGARQLMTAHGGQTAAVETFGDRDWIAVDTVYSYLADLRAPLRAAFLRRPIRPFVLIETTYEGEHDARPEQIRRQAWTAMLSGAGGQFFGNNPIWHFDGPTLFPHQTDWQPALGSAGARDMTRLSAFFAAQQWAEITPDLDDSMATASSGSRPAPVSAHTPDGRLAIIYIPADAHQPRDVTLYLHALASALKAKWINPARDDAPTDERSVTTNVDAQRLRLPGDNGTGANDWVLVVEAR